MHMCSINHLYVYVGDCTHVLCHVHGYMTVLLRQRRVMRDAVQIMHNCIVCEVCHQLDGS